MTVDEQFIKSLYAEPSGERKKPTIFDEIRWATQHSQKPLEQVIQLISEFHGPWTGMNQNTMYLLNSLLALFSSTSNKSLAKNAKSAVKLLDAIQNVTSIGRQNNIVANDMSVPLLREFVERSQCIHPSVNSYIQNNIGKFPYFQQISEQVGSLGQVVISNKEIHPIKRIETNGINSMSTDYPFRRNIDKKVFKNVKSTVDNSNSLVNSLFLRAMKPEGNNAILLESGNTTSAHGYNFTMDVKNSERNNNSVAECLSKAVSKFGPSIQLCDSYFPVEYKVVNKPEFYTVSNEHGQYMADFLNRPLIREPELPVVDDGERKEVA